LKKVRIKTLIKQRTIYTKNITKAYIKKIEKDLKIKTFKYHFYIEHYIVVLEFIQFIETNKTANIIFNKELKIIERYLIVKD